MPCCVIVIGSAIRPWPDAIDRTMVAAYLLLAFGVPALGYVLMALDFRRYLRSLRRALVAISYVAAGRTPCWAADDRPPCMQALELALPSTEAAVLAAYRRRVKELHPDRGGDLQQFLRLQKHFEQALALARSHAQRGGPVGGTKAQ